MQRRQIKSLPGLAADRVRYIHQRDQHTAFIILRPRLVVIPGHLLAASREPPLLGQTPAELLVIDADDLLLDRAEVALGAGDDFADLPQLFRGKLQLNQDAD